jgi:hypothetical protein
MANNNNATKEAIKAYLDKRAATDELFAVSYAKPKKNIDECFRYILGEARKRGTQVCMTDEEVFGLAVHYYDEDNIAVKSLGGTAARVSAPKVELTEEEKEKAREAAIQAYERQCMMEEAEREAKRKKAEADRKRAETQKRKQQMASSPSLFDFDEL